MTRKLTIRVEETISEDQYTDLANAIWMILRTDPYDFTVEPDSKADLTVMNAAWEQYGIDASWEG